MSVDIRWQVELGHWGNQRASGKTSPVGNYVLVVLISSNNLTPFDLDLMIFPINIKSSSKSRIDNYK